MSFPSTSVGRRTWTWSLEARGILTARMSENNPPFHPSYYAPSFETPDNDPSYWALPEFPPFGAQYIDPAYGSTESSGQSMTPNGQNVAGKIAIPRHTFAGSPVPSGRVRRACQNCRDQKAKCSGHQPTCQRCEESGARCYYGDRKREKTAK